MNSTILYIVIIVVCLVFSAYFSATETAFTTLNKVRVKTKADDGNKRAKLVLKLANNYDKLLSTILIGNNIVNILASSMGTLLFIEWCNGNSDLASVLSTIVLTVLVLIFGEISPKSLAKEFPETFASFSAPIINALCIVLTPINFLFTMWKKFLNLFFKNKEDTTITDDELITMVDEAEHEGGINSQESELIKSAIEFNDLEVKDILIPRVLAERVRTPEVRALFEQGRTDYLVNPTGKFVIGGPHGDTGLTGRKIIVDTYGGRGAHGGGAFSGKDPSKVDRSAAYAARHIAKNMVAAGVADEMLVQLSYAIGRAEPVSIYVNTYGRSHVALSDGEIARKIGELFDLRPHAIIDRLHLRQPMYEETASYGHMGRTPRTVVKEFGTDELGKKRLEVELFTWEKLDATERIREAFGIH